MKEMNFRKLETLTVPEELMEKLLAIPETEEEKAPVVIPWWRNRAVITAASLVLVSVLSLAVYFSIGNKINDPVAVKPSSSATEIVWSTDESGETIATEVVIVPDGTQPTEAKSGIVQFIERIFGIDGNTAPTTAESGSGGTTPATKTSPTDGRSDPTAPSQGWKPPVPTLPPIEAPTLAPTEAPVEPVAPTEPPWDDPPEPTEGAGGSAYPPDEGSTEPAAEAPTEPPHARPTQPPTEDPDPEAKYYHDTITTNLHVSDIPEGSTLYIRLIDSRGRQLGDSDWYSDQHLVTVDNWGERLVSISYTPKDYGIIPQRGYYRYKIYNQDGVTVQGFYTVGLNP